MVWRKVNGEFTEVGPKKQKKPKAAPKAKKPTKPKKAQIHAMKMHGVSKRGGGF